MARKPPWLELENKISFMNTYRVHTAGEVDKEPMERMTGTWGDCALQWQNQWGYCWGKVTYDGSVLLLSRLFLQEGKSRRRIFCIVAVGVCSWVT